jgi:hypothetical protein
MLIVRLGKREYLEMGSRWLKSLPLVLAAIPKTSASPVPRIFWIPSSEGFWVEYRSAVAFAAYAFTAAGRYHLHLKRGQPMVHRLSVALTTNVANDGLRAVQYVRRLVPQPFQIADGDV